MPSDSDIGVTSTAVSEDPPGLTVTPQRNWGLRLKSQFCIELARKALVASEVYPALNISYSQQLPKLIFVARIFTARTFGINLEEACEIALSIEFKKLLLTPSSRIYQAKVRLIVDSISNRVLFWISDFIV